MHRKEDEAQAWMRCACAEDLRAMFCIIEQVTAIIQERREKMGKANNLTVFYTDRSGLEESITMDGFLYEPVVYELIKRNYAPCMVVQHYVDGDDACPVHIERGGEV